MTSYHGQPSSIPSDYALISRYANQRQNYDEHALDSDEETSTDSEETISHTRRRQKKRRLSVYSYHDDIQRVPAPRATENTPLLHPDVPRIIENVDQLPSSSSSYSTFHPQNSIPSSSILDSNEITYYNEPTKSTLTIFFEELAILSRYSLPVYLTHLLEFSLVMSSVLSIGHLSTTALAAITLGSMTANVTAFSIIQGFVSALDTILPAAWTSDKPELVGLWSQRMGVVLAASLIPMLGVWFGAQGILEALGQETEVARLAGVYLRWLSLGLPAYAFNGVSRRYFQSQNLFTVPTRIIFIAAPVNAVLNYVLVWGPGKLEWIRLGFIGAPIATAISFNLVAAMSLAYGVWIEREKKRERNEWEESMSRLENESDVDMETENESEGDVEESGLYIRGKAKANTDGSENTEPNNPRTHPRTQNDRNVPKPKSAWHPLTLRSFTSLGPLVELGLGGVGQTASEWWAWELVGLAAALLGPVVLAAQSVLLVSASSTFQAPFALGVGGSVRIGNLLGERHARRARIAANTCIVMALALAGVLSSMFLIFRSSWSYIFNDDPAVAKVVSEILPLVALFQVFDGNAAITSGILRARGKQITGALLNLSAYYIVGIPLGIYLAFKFDLGLAGLWIGLTVSLIYCSLFGSILCLRTDWEREVRKVRERLRADGNGNSNHSEVGAKGLGGGH